MREQQIQLMPKVGDGVGAHLDFYLGDDIMIAGTLTFHEGRDWQITNSERVPEIGWEVFKRAVELAREMYPAG